MSQSTIRRSGYDRLSVSAVLACLGILAAVLPARGFEAGPKTTAHWIFDSAHVEDGAFKNLAPVPGPLPRLPWMGDAPVFKEFEGRRGVQGSFSSFGELPQHLDLTAGNSEKVISYGALIKLDTMRKDYSSTVAGFYDACRFMVDTVGRLHLGIQNAGVRRPRQWLRTDSDLGEPVVQVKKWHEVVFTIDARDPGRVLGYLFLDGKQLRNPHFAVNDDGVRTVSDITFRVGKLPGFDGPPWYGGPFHGLISELIIEKGYLIQPTLPHTGPLNNRVNLGTRSVPARPGDTLRVPVLLTNYSDLKLSSCQFNLRLNSQVATLLDVEPAGIAADWTLDWNSAGAGAYAVSLAGLQAPMAYGEGELLTLVLAVNPEAGNGSYSDMSLDDVKLDENRQLEVSTTTGRIRVEQGIVRGDVNGDGKADRLDAEKVLRYVVGALLLPDSTVPNFTVAVADVSGNGEITSYDGALILQHAAGLLPDFPAGKPSGAAKAAAGGRTAASAPTRLFLSEPVSLGGGLFEYRVRGENLEAMASGEFVLELAPGKALKIESTATSLRGATLTGSSLGNLYTLTLATNDRFQVFSKDFVTLKVAQSEGGSAVSLKSAYLNEGALTGNFLSEPVLKGVSARALPGSGKSPRLDIRIAGGVLLLPWSASGAVSVTLYDLEGRLRKSSGFSGPGLHRMSLESLPPGLFTFEIWAGGQRHRGMALRM